MYTRDAGQAPPLIINLAAYRGKPLLRQEGERTPLVPLQACAGWVKTVSCHAHPRILLPQNRCLPEPLAAPFPRQPEPRYNTLDFAGKVVCQRAFRRSLDSSRQGTGKWGALRRTGCICYLTRKTARRFYLTIRKIRAIITIRRI